jgi:hypothetical protein
VLLACCDRLIAADRVAPALRIWNALVVRGSIRGQPLDPGRGFLLVNGDFRFAPLSRGFDWRVPEVTGVSVARLEPSGLRISLSGRQPEHCEMLAQVLPLTAGRYGLSFEYRAAGVVTGVRWTISGAASPPLADGDWTAADLEFTVPAPGPARLSLVYQRLPGTTRAEGSIWLRRVMVRRSL